MPARRATSDPHELTDPSRRRALKAAALTGTAAVVWTEPTIKGLARRPAYADVGSGTETITFTTNDDMFGGGTIVPGTATGQDSMMNDVALTLTLATTATATTLTIGVTGCVCTITSVMPAGFSGPVLQIPDPDNPALPPEELAYTGAAGATLSFALASTPPTSAELLDGIITLTCT